MSSLWYKRLKTAELVAEGFSAPAKWLTLAQDLAIHSRLENDHPGTLLGSGVRRSVTVELVYQWY